jgi:hypothetical protein
VGDEVNVTVGDKLGLGVTVRVDVGVLDGLAVYVAVWFGFMVIVGVLVFRAT